MESFASCWYLDHYSAVWSQPQTVLNYIKTIVWWHVRRKLYEVIFLKLPGNCHIYVLFFFFFPSLNTGHSPVYVHQKHLSNHHFSWVVLSCCTDCLAAVSQGSNSNNSASFLLHNVQNWKYTGKSLLSPRPPSPSQENELSDRWQNIKYKSFSRSGCV